MNTENMSLARKLTITLVTLAIVITTGIVLTVRPFDAPGTRLTATFDRAGQGLGKDSQVKVRGVTVGTVDSIELAAGGKALVRMSIDPGVRIPDSVTASVEPASVFGPKFLNLIPGPGEAKGPFLADGRNITRTSGSRDLSELLADADRGLSAVDPQEVAVITRTLAVGLGGQGTRLREIVDNVDTIEQVAYRQRANARLFLGDGADLATALQNSGPALNGITADTNALITQAASGEPGRLGDFGDSLADVSGLVAHGFNKRGDQLREAFRSAERLTKVIYAQLGLAGNGVRNLAGLLPIYQDLVKNPAIGDRHYLASQIWLSSDPCQLLVGVCGPGTRTNTGAGTGGSGTRGGR